MDILPRNLTSPVGEPQWNSKGAWKLPGWAEPLIVVTILFGAMIMTRSRGFRILGGKAGPYRSTLDQDPDSARSSDELLRYDPDNADDEQEYFAATKQLPKTRRILGVSLNTPNSSRFKNNIHSRILQRFPFLIEMFYWIINYLFYRLTAVVSQAIFVKTGIWEVAESHGIAILEIEQFSWLGFLIPVRETDVQQWFMNGHQDALTVLNRAYALIHIPGTVGFIAWYYYIAPSHPTFATVRRTMTLTNFMAFATFCSYPCMPPRLLPKEYGFLDTVRHDDAQSVWMSGKYVNSLAAMPSMHFGYAFCIGCTMIYHSGIFRTRLENGESRKSLGWKIFFLLLGIGYPAMILTTIVATANHYILDAMVATLYVLIAYTCNKVFYIFLPLEDWLLWAIRAEKPIPSTGERFRELGHRL
ncbi:PAP2 superfamily-domain-containing protein [Delphinella strobiligena]|nr:PAP2 superfamily-domain-containing protein [Delphinella strobiligena]